MKDIIHSFTVKKNLCPDIWDEFELKPEIKRRLTFISIDFFKSLEFELANIKDIIFTGSLANYNWSKFSDIDLHIMIDFNDVHINKSFVKNYVDAKKNLWNKEHNIKIYGFDVEIYIQDINEEHSSTGIYSIVNNQWKIKPEKQFVHINKNQVKMKASNLMSVIDSIIEDSEFESLKGITNKIHIFKQKLRRFRKCGLEKGGEYSIENLAFKTLRRNGYLDKLKDFELKFYDKRLSLK